MFKIQSKFEKSNWPLPVKICNLLLVRFIQHSATQDSPDRYVTCQIRKLRLLLYLHLGVLGHGYERNTWGLF